MPRYNLNHQDIDTIITGLNHMAINAPSTKEHTRITNLKNRLTSKLSSKNQTQEIDAWEVFNGNLLKEKD